MELTLYTTITLTNSLLDQVIHSPQEYTASQLTSHNMSCVAWLALHASQYSERERTSLQLLLNFLEISELNDLLALDEQALTYACTHKPPLDDPRYFKIADVCRLRHILSSSDFPNFRHLRIVSLTDRRHDYQTSLVHPTPDPSDSQSRFGCPAITVSQLAASLIAQNTFTNAVATFRNTVTLLPKGTAESTPPNQYFVRPCGASLPSCISDLPTVRHPRIASKTERIEVYQPSLVLSTPSFSDSQSRLCCPTKTVTQSAGPLIAQNTFTNAVATFPNTVTLLPKGTAQPTPPDESFVPPCDASKASFISPIAQRTPRYSEWTLVRTVDLTERLNAHLGADRLYYNGGDYYTKEWPVVIKLLWPHICDDTAFDCFWNWRDPTPVPVRLFWHKSATSYPPIGSASFGVEYACDFVTVSGCPKKMQVLRSCGSASVFELHLRSLPARHGCIHTLSKNKCSSTANTGEVPSLHAGLKTFIRRQSFNHDSSSNLTWGNISEKASSYILKSTFLHCQLPHLPPSSSTLRDHRTQCQHPRTLNMLRRVAAYSCVPHMITDPCTEEIPTNKPCATKRQYSNVACSVAPLLLEDGHTLLGSHEFTQPVAEQCREYLRSCNNRFHGQLDGPENSSLDIMHADFTKHNLYLDYINALCNHGRLDLFRFNVIGYCYSLDPPNASRNTTTRESTYRLLLSCFHLHVFTTVPFRSLFSCFAYPVTIFTASTRHSHRYLLTSVRHGKQQSWAG